MPRNNSNGPTKPSPVQGQVRRIRKNHSRRTRRQTQRKVNHIINVPSAKARNIGRRYQNSIITNVTKNSPKLRSDKMLMDYLKCLVNNADFESRYPDSNPRRTSVFTSVSSVDIPIIFDTNATQGRFSLAIQPIMGDISTPAHYQLAIANVKSGLPTSPWATQDWSSATAYQSLYNGRDPRIDINSPYLVSNVTGNAHYTTVFTGAGAALAQPSVSTGAQNFYGNLPNSTLTIDSQLNGLSLVLPASPAGYAVIPPGQYVVTASVAATSVAALTNVIPILFQPNGSTKNQVTLVASAAPSVNGAFVCSCTWLISVNVSTSLLFTIQKTAAGTFIGAGDLSALTTDVVISPADWNMYQMPQNYGAMEMVRPVSQTVLATYMGPSLQNGGRIASAYVPSGMLNSNFFNNAVGSATGQLQNFENVTLLDHAYDGELKHGTYCWWAPYDPSDVSFNSPGASNAMNWPSIVISGLFNPNVQSTGAQSDVLRVRVLTTFEFITKVTAFDSETYCGSQGVIDSVNKALQDAPHCMANGEHKSWLSSIIGGTGRAISDHSDELAGIATGIASLLL